MTIFKNIFSFQLVKKLSKTFKENVREKKENNNLFSPELDVVKYTKVPLVKYN